MPDKPIADENLIHLKNQLDFFAPRSSERQRLVSEFAALYGVSTATIYRRLRERRSPKALHRSDKGRPRFISPAELDRYCQIIAALKLRTRNKKGRMLPTTEAIRILEDYGVETPQGLIRVAKGLLKRPTVNRYLNAWGYDPCSLAIQKAVTRFEAKTSNECWQFDLSPSDLKSLSEVPAWVNSADGRPSLMLYSIVDDRSRAAYQEYHLVYGEDVESALRFLFRAMSPKDIPGFPFHGRPHIIYMDNGPIAQSGVFNRVMKNLDIEVLRHMPASKAKRRTAARSKGKVERPFRTVKELHETLYHFHKPRNEREANEWLLNFILRYNERQHGTGNVSRIQDWIDNIPESGLRTMCSWERFCRFTREPERRKVGPDARVSIAGILYQVDHNLACEEVIVWWGLFDRDIFVECADKKYGPYSPVSGPLPLRKYRTLKKSLKEERAEMIEELAACISLPLEALIKDSRSGVSLLRSIPAESRSTPFRDPDPFNELSFSSVISAKLAISSLLGIPLAKLSEDKLALIDEFLNATLEKSEVFRFIHERIARNETQEFSGGDVP